MTGPARAAAGHPEPALTELAHVGPHLLRVMLGARLRRLREGQRIGRKQAADTIRSSDSKLSRLETGRTGYKLRDMEDLLTLYGVTEEPNGRHCSRWPGGRASPHGGRITARSFRCGSRPTSTSNQTPRSSASTSPATSRACCRPPTTPGPSSGTATLTTRPGPIDRRVDLRLRRQHVLAARPSGPPQVWAVLDEAALRRPAGSAATMRAQLRHLIRRTEDPHVRIFIVPFSAGQAGAVGSPVSILRFPGQLIPDVVYTENLTQAIYPEMPAEIRHYWHLMNTLATHALSADDTMTFVRQVLSDT